MQAVKLPSPDAAHDQHHRTKRRSCPDVLAKISMVGNDMPLDPGIGTCIKMGQGVPFGVGQPTMHIDGLTVGGTAA